MVPLSKLDFYARLGVRRNATPDEIKRAYRKGALRYHPDRNPQNPERATEDFKALKEAYEVLSDPKRRAEYDRSLNNRATGWHGPRTRTTTQRRDPPRRRDRWSHLYDLYKDLYKEFFYSSHNYSYENIEDIIGLHKRKKKFKEFF